MVDTAPGKFHIQAQSFGKNFAAHMTNVSHIVHHFSFGDVESQESVENGGWKGIPSKFVHSLHPLDGNVYVSSGLHQAYHHHMRVVTTEFGDSHLIKWTRDKVRRVYRILSNTQLSTYRTSIVPEAKFEYDLSPIALSYLEVSRNWYDYSTGLLAIIGGTFTVVGMLESSVSLFSKRNRYYL